MWSRQDGRWSIPIARVRGAQVRVHVFFLLFAAWTMYIAWHSEQLPGNQGNLPLVAAICLLILGASVFLQEVARLLLVRRFGGQPAMIVLGPHGGMSSLDDVARPRDELLVHLAAPATSVVLMAFASLVLFAEGSFDSQLLHPFKPIAVAEGETWVAAFKLALWTNALLALLHVIPAFPFHGGRALRAAILWRAPHLGRREASRMVIRLARLIACIVVVAAVFLLRESPGVTTWSALLLLAVLVFLGAEHEQGAWVETAAGKANVPTFMDIPADHGIPQTAQHRLTASEQARGSYESEPLRSPHVDEAEPYASAAPNDDDDDLQDVQVDEVLMRIHQHGLGSLSDSDRAILERASRKYRQKIGF